ncbi:hypothetical protein PHMEG_00028013 [Phytophthora megakarya]|uniref:Uncharacterized protein n=1 Tax=Phytophthora megakarya TaxID=4795 RepID=A0A225V4A1_9STRA|nr:hypothetical protein PHMEG_00028013 [Phytophthora megakarya]
MATPRSPTSRRKSEPASNYTFTPQSEPQYIAIGFRRKTRTYVYVSGLVVPDAVKVKTLRGAGTQIYDILLCSKELLIQLFAKESQEESVEWLQSASNYDNLSATAANHSIFEETPKRVTLDETKIGSLVYCINDVPEDVREAVLLDGDVKHIQIRCSTEDLFLRDLTFVTLHRQKSNKRLGRMPKTVLRRFPVQMDPSTGEKRAAAKMSMVVVQVIVDTSYQRNYLV